MSSMATRGRTGRAVFVIVAIGLLLLGLVAAFSLGLFLIPVPLVMFVSLGWWGRRWVVVGLVTGAVVASAVLLFATPITRTSLSYKGPEGKGTTEFCGRLTGPDIPLAQCDGAFARALLLAGAAGIASGLAVTFVGRTGSKPD